MSARHWSVKKSERKELGRLSGDWPVTVCLVGQGSVALTGLCSCLIFLSCRVPGGTCRGHKMCGVLVSLPSALRSASLHLKHIVVEGSPQGLQKESNLPYETPPHTPKRINPHFVGFGRSHFLVMKQSNPIISKERNKSKGRSKVPSTFATWNPVSERGF